MFCSSTPDLFSVSSSTEASKAKGRLRNICKRALFNVMSKSMSCLPKDFYIFGDLFWLQKSLLMSNENLGPGAIPMVSRSLHRTLSRQVHIRCSLTFKRLPYVFSETSQRKRMKKFITIIFSGQAFFLQDLQTEASTALLFFKTRRPLSFLVP